MFNKRGLPFCVAHQSGKIVSELQIMFFFDKMVLNTVN